MDYLYNLFSNATYGDHIVIAPGTYCVQQEIPLTSGITVSAEGAVFNFPKQLSHTHVRMFTGENIQNLTWRGGKFVGYVYDPAQEDNIWEPNIQSIGIYIFGGSNLVFSGINGLNLSGPVIFAEGCETGSIDNITITDLVAENCGKFMWDYGYLWQRITFPEYHTKTDVENAYRYMPEECYSDKLYFNDEIVSSVRYPKRHAADHAVTFFGSKLPPEIKKGRYYYADENNDGLLIRERLSDSPIRFTPGDYDCRLFRGIYNVYHAMYAPFGCGQSKGAMDIRFAENVHIEGCIISAMGDATHFHSCKNGKITGNYIKGARMGAMYLSSCCDDILVTNNIVDGNNGSRVLTVETGGKNIRIINNIFKNGGRGTWIDTPESILIKNNIFEHNTCKSSPDASIGRISPTEGTFEHFAEIYFTTRIHGAVYGNITLESNIIRTGDGCNAALAFNAHGKQICIKNNLFEGSNRDIYISNECENICILSNYGNPIKTNTISNESFDIPGTIYLPDGMRK